MPGKLSTRRKFLANSAATLAAASLVRTSVAETRPANFEKPRAKVERLGIAAIGMRYQGTVITEKARQFGDVVAIADVDRHVREQARASFGSTPRIFEDYREMLDRPDIDVVLIGAPDHWHSKMLIDSVRRQRCVLRKTTNVDD